jgi:hypothetical protein
MTYKVQIYISDQFSKFFLPFLLYRNILYEIFQAFLTTDIEYIYNIENIDNNENTILITTIYCLHNIKNNNLFSNIINTKALIINTEFYKNLNTNEIVKYVDLNKCDFHILEYNVLNYQYFKENYKNINIYYAPLIYHSFLEIYYKNQIANNYIEWNQKDIDVLFVGNVNDRRQKVLDKIAQKYKVHIIQGSSGENENRIICENLERSKIVLNILYYEENSIFDYYRNSFLISNKMILVSEKPKNINYELEYYLEGINDILFMCEYDDFYNTVDNILTNYNQLQIDEMKNNQYNWFKSKNDMDYFVDFINKNISNN